MKFSVFDSLIFIKRLIMLIIISSALMIKCWLHPRKIQKIEKISRSVAWSQLELLTPKQFVFWCKQIESQTFLIYFDLSQINSFKFFRSLKAFTNVH
jgi:hypothetical protein